MNVTKITLTELEVAQAARDVAERERLEHELVEATEQIELLEALFDALMRERKEAKP